VLLDLEPRAMKPTLLILAAGMGSRYGGLKQIDPVGPHGEAIIDYSMFDAIHAGFGKIVFVIRPAFEEAFRKNIGSKLDGLVEVDYVYQELDSCVEDFEVPAHRENPWGTGHAVLSARDAVTDHFAVITADDYYGPNSYQMMAHYLRDQPEDYGMVGFSLRQTLSEHGDVSRGVCQCNRQVYLDKVTERTKIKKKGTGAVFWDEDGQLQDLTGDEIVSMSFWGFSPQVFIHMGRLFRAFLQERGQELKSEFYIPTVVDHLIAEGTTRTKVMLTPDQWFGVTYREDKEKVQKKIAALVTQGVYPDNLWKSLPPS
jgi:dTDP-glucose pyrophosphorylase